MPYVPRTKDAKQKLEGASIQPLRTVTLDCGCTTDREPEVDAPVRRWWCCKAWRKATR